MGTLERFHDEQAGLTLSRNGKEVCFSLPHIARTSTIGANFELLKRITQLKRRVHMLRTVLRLGALGGAAIILILLAPFGGAVAQARSQALPHSSAAVTIFATGLNNRCKARRIAGTVTLGPGTLLLPGDAGASFSRSCSKTRNPYASITRQAW